MKTNSMTFQVGSPNRAAELQGESHRTLVVAGQTFRPHKKHDKFLPAIPALLKTRSAELGESYWVVLLTSKKKSTASSPHSSVSMDLGCQCSAQPAVRSQ